MNIKVIHNLPSWLPLTQNWIYQQILFLPPWIDTHVVCERTENLHQFDISNIYCINSKSHYMCLWDEYAIKILKTRPPLSLTTKVVKSLKGNLLHSHFGQIGYFNLHMARSAKLRHIVNFYGYDVNRLPQKSKSWRERLKVLLSEVDCVLCEGPHMAKSIVSLGCPENKVRIHHLGVNVDKIPFRPRKWHPPEELRVLIAATFTEKKGIPYALEALGRLQSQVPIRITIIGDARNEPEQITEKKKILATIEKYQMQNKTTMMGYQPLTTLHEEAYKHHIFLSPSITSSLGDTEGGAPVTIIEMAASGMPIVSTRHCDIPEVIKQPNSSFLADERDVEGLIRAIESLLEAYPNWPDLLDSARRHIELEYNVKTQAKRIAELYRSVATPN